MSHYAANGFSTALPFRYAEDIFAQEDRERKVPPQSTFKKLAITFSCHFQGKRRLRSN